jgi:hypothetical protein
MVQWPDRPRTTNKPAHGHGVGQWLQFLRYLHAQLGMAEGRIR